MKPTDETKQVGAIVARLIKQSGNTIVAVGSMIGCSENTIMAWRKGEAVIPYAMIKKMCDTLKCHESDRLYLISAALLAIGAKWRTR